MRPAPLVLALAMSMGAAPLSAQQAGQAPGAPMQISIAAQPLPQALNQWSLQTRIPLAVSQVVVSGKNAPAVSGSLSPRQALERLLAGSGLTGRFEGSLVTVEPAVPGSSTAVTLAPLNVTALAYRSTTTEGSGSYTTPAMTTATKLDLSMRQTPQAVTVITRQRIEDQGLSTVNDVVQSAPGLTYRRFGPARASFYARGMYVDNIMYDGLPVSLDSSNLSQDLLATDMAVYDHVEIVRGATGLVQGAGNPAAAVNLVRKRPTQQTQASITTSVGNWDRYRTELDASGPLSTDGSLRGRVVAAYQDEGSYKDREKSDRKLLYGIVEKDLGPRTLLTLSALYQQDVLGGNGFTGLPVAADGSDLHLPRSTSYADDWEYWDKDTTSFFTGLEHRFDSGWRMQLSAYHADADFNMQGHYIGLSVLSGLYTQYGARNKHEEKQDSYDLYVSGPFSLMGRRHDLVFGASYRKVDFDGGSRQGLVLASGMDLYDWDPHAIADPHIPLRDWLDSDIEQKSAYATARFNLADPLKLIVGARLDWYDYSDAVRTYPGFIAETPSLVTHNQYSVTRNVTQYAGLIYDIGRQHSVYASYTDIFKPQNYLSANNTLLDPIQGKNYEIGIKGEYFDGALNASAAVFRLDQADRAYRLADQTVCGSYPSTVCYASAGLVRSEGFELEVQGALNPNWQIGAGYTYTNARYRRDANPLNVGQLFDTDTPRRLLKLSSTYQLTGELERWRVGASAYWQDDIFNQGTSSGIAYRVEQDSYALVDLLVGYQASEKLDFRLNLNNVLDKTYYNAITGSITFPSNVYGEPRNGMLTMHYRF